MRFFAEAENGNYVVEARLFRNGALSLLWRNDTLDFRVVASATELLTNEARWTLQKRITERLTQHSGIWTIPSYCKTNGSPVHHECRFWPESG